MKLKITIIAAIVIILIIAGSVLAFQEGLKEEITDFGSWGQQIYFEFEDGSVENFEGSLLSFLHDGKTVTSITYILGAKATGTGYNNIEIDLSNYVLSWMFTPDSGMGACTWQDSVGAGDQKDEFAITTIAVDGQWNEILNIYHTPDQLTQYLTYGLYIFEVRTGGSLRYRADGEAWIDVPLPEDLSANIEIKDDRTITVIFDQIINY